MKVFGCILLLIVLFLMVPVIVHIDSAPEITITVKYFWFKKGILPKGEKTAGKKKASARPKTKKKKKEREKRALSYTLQELLDLLQTLQRRTSPAVRRLLRRTSLAKFRLCMIVVGEDAAETAIKFGKVNAQVFTAVALVKETIRLKADQIEILPGFGASQSEISYSGVVRLAPLALLVAGVQIAFWGLVSALPLFLRSSKKKTSKNAGDDAAAALRKEDQNGKETPLERGA
ncbi:hypothetical protein ACS3UN_00330 [Oscillospiraceae bacterium LTW-04]|nr:hypothetical protein RBH76_10105 [Oscillospiraceae bacterium MB24-C1]